MRLLLDTHAFIWFLNGDEQLPLSIQNTISNRDNSCFLSIASIWEIAIKNSLGKLHLQDSFDNIATFMAATNIESLPITFPHLQKLLKLDYHHRDPFDRIIIAQAITENMTLISKDEIFQSYTSNLIWQQNIN